MNLTQSLTELEEATRLISRCHDDVLLISNFEGVNVDHRFATHAYDLGKAILRHRIQKVAVVGIESIKFVMREAFKAIAGKHPSFFQTEREALTWLVD